jgi:hypothetical protein
MLRSEVRSWRIYTGHKIRLLQIKMPNDVKIRNHTILRNLLYLYFGVKVSNRGPSQCDSNVLDLYLLLDTEQVVSFIMLSQQTSRIYITTTGTSTSIVTPRLVRWSSEGETFTQTIHVLAQDISLASWGYGTKNNIGPVRSHDLRTYKCVLSSRIWIPGRSVPLPGGRYDLWYKNTRCQASRSSECTPFYGRQGVKCTHSSSGTLRAGPVTRLRS